MCPFSHQISSFLKPIFLSPSPPGVGDFLPYYSIIDFFDLYFRTFSFALNLYALCFYWSLDSGDADSQRFLKVVKDLSTLDWRNKDLDTTVLEQYGEKMEYLSELMKIQTYIMRLFFVVGFLMIFRVIVFLRIQPRCAILFKTIQLALDDLFHFLVVFTLIFGVAGMLAHWFFGTDYEAFATINMTMYTQFMMLIGEFPWLEGPPQVRGSLKSKRNQERYGKRKSQLEEDSGAVSGTR